MIGTQSSFARDSMYHMLAEKTHAEIFKTEKDAVKKQINYSNYSLHPSHLISNKPMQKDRVMGEYVNDKIMDYKTPYVAELRSSIRDHTTQMNEKFNFNNGRGSKPNKNGMDALAMSNMKNGSSHVPVAPVNPNKPLFHGQSIYVDQYKDIVEKRKSDEQGRRSWLKQNAMDVRQASLANRGKYRLSKDDLVVALRTAADSQLTPRGQLGDTAGRTNAQTSMDHYPSSLANDQGTGKA